VTGDITRDVVVTVPKNRWLHWLAEGDLPGDPLDELGEWDFSVGAMTPTSLPRGSRVYVVAHGLLRGYAPLVRVNAGLERLDKGLVRCGGAVAVTLQPFGKLEPVEIKGFQGWRYRWWDRKDEVDFPDFATAGLPAKLRVEVDKLLVARATGPAMRKRLRAWGISGVE
jgi:hypothetical protein